MMFGKIHTRKSDPRILLPNGMGYRALLIVGVQYKQHLEIVLKNLQEQSLYAKMYKCEFGMKELLYLGHIIGKGVKVHMEKIRVFLEWPSPKNIIELRGFIGICTYYRKFVKGFSKLTSPLIYLTKKDSLKWNEEA